MFVNLAGDKKGCDGDPEVEVPARAPAMAPGCPARSRPRSGGRVQPLRPGPASHIPMPFTQSTPVTLSPPSVMKDSNTVYRTWGHRGGAAVRRPWPGPSRLRPGPSVLEPENSWPEDHHGAVPISGKEARTSQRVGSGRQDILEGTGPLETNPAGGAATEPAHYVQVSISFPKADPELGRQRLRCYAAPQCGVPPLAPRPWRLCPLTFKPHPTRRR